MLGGQRKSLLMHFQYYINHHLSQYEDQDNIKKEHLNVNTPDIIGA